MKQESTWKRLEEIASAQATSGAAVLVSLYPSLSRSKTISFHFVSFQVWDLEFLGVHETLYRIELYIRGILSWANLQMIEKPFGTVFWRSAVFGISCLFLEVKLAVAGG